MFDKVVMLYCYFCFQLVGCLHHYYMGACSNLISVQCAKLKKKKKIILEGHA